jgi:hypothetical protein
MEERLERFRIHTDHILRFFHAEVAQRWQLEAREIETLAGDCDSLVSLLTGKFEFASGRATAEAEEFVTKFLDGIALAVDAPPQCRICYDESRKNRVYRTQRGAA